ncbi:MAG TPA: hypothetical protein VI757_15850 [Bacteroidia bacterium]|nr:hypothetical protein [Bacteroidia bacterium]
MITLEKIIASNLEMLKSQESELLKSLSFVQKAKKLFQSQNGKPKGRPKGSTNVRKKSAVRVKKASLKSKSVRAPKPGSHLFNIVNLLKQKNAPLKPQELIETLFNQQTKDKDITHFRSLISPTLSNAYTRGIVLRKEGKYLLPA